MTPTFGLFQEATPISIENKEFENDVPKIDSDKDLEENQGSKFLTLGSDFTSQISIYEECKDDTHESDDDLEYKDYSFGDSDLDDPDVRTAVLKAILEVIEITIKKKAHSSITEDIILPRVRLLDGVYRYEEYGETFPLLKVAYDLSAWVYLRHENWPDANQENHEEFRELAREFLVSILDSVYEFGYVNHIWLHLSDCNLSFTDSSMRSIFNGQCFSKPLHREKHIETLNLSHTNTTERSLLSLHKLENLTTLYLDYCPSLHKRGKKIFSLLGRKAPIAKLTRLSVVGTSSFLSHKWFKEIGISCPALDKVYFTRKEGTKAVGLKDNILMQTMRDPQLLPCGHIHDLEPILRTWKCAIDSRPVLKEELMAINPSISYLYKNTEEQWCIEIVDVLRAPIVDKTIYHTTCGSFYNIDSIDQLFGIDNSIMTDEELIEFMYQQECVECLEPIESNVRLAFTNTVTDIPTYHDLSAISAYILFNKSNRSRK